MEFTYNEVAEKLEEFKLINIKGFKACRALARNKTGFETAHKEYQTLINADAEPIVKEAMEIGIYANMSPEQATASKAWEKRSAKAAEEKVDVVIYRIKEKDATENTESKNILPIAFFIDFEDEEVEAKEEVAK